MQGEGNDIRHNNWFVTATMTTFPAQHTSSWWQNRCGRHCWHWHCQLSQWWSV